MVIDKAASNGATVQQAAQTDLPGLVTLKQLGEYLGLADSRTVKGLVDAGQLPPPVIQHGRTWRWRTEDIRKHLDRQWRLFDGHLGITQGG